MTTVYRSCRSHVVFRREYCSSVLKPISGSTRFRKHEWYKPPTPEMGSERFWLQRRIEKYSELLYRLESPRPTSFMVHGRSFPLPYGLDGLPDIDSPAGIRPEKLRSLAAYFGEAATVCFAGETNTGFSMSLYATQSNANVLHEFVLAFGGTIRLDSSAAGGRQMNLRWRIYGNHARRVASCLLTVPCSKHKLLEMANHWPGPGEARQRKIAEARELRQQCRMNADFDSIQALSGFLDKKMTMDVNSMCNKLMLRVSSLQKIVIDKFMNFLTLLGIDAGVLVPFPRPGRDVNWMWYQTKTEHSFVLLRAIQPYISRKKTQVDLILANPHRLREIRPQLFSLNTNVKRFYRNDDHSAHLSRQINTLQVLIIRRSSASKLEKLKDLIDERELYRLRKGCLDRRIFIRSQLDDGAVVNPSRRKSSGSRTKWPLTN